MKKVKITAIRKVQYDYLMAKYENPIEHEIEVHTYDVDFMQIVNNI